jgi:uroporphyrinogen decarboxylase
MATRNKREHLQALLGRQSDWDYVPAAFFTHFDKQSHTGQAAVDRHVEFFRYTGMDFAKIQYEHAFPKLDFIRRPADWLDMPRYDADFFREPVQIVKGLVAELGKEALVLQTLYSPYMCAADSSSHELITRHLQEGPDHLRKGLSVIRDSLRIFIEECVKAGVDGFYASTQGGEHLRFANETDFRDYILPLDLSLLEQVNEATRFNILHICDYWLPYDSIDVFTRYPCQVVSAPTSLRNGGRVRLDELYAKFRKPILGGMNRKGAIQSGPQAVLEKEVRGVLAQAPPRFLLGADCTVADANWDYLRAAVSLAHDHRRS